MNKYIKYISMFAGGLLLGGALSACTDKDLDMGVSSDDSIYQIEEDSYGLGVTISLDKLVSPPSRAVDYMSENDLKYIEEYVDTENLYILFFNLDGTFLFQIQKPVAIPIGQSQNNNDNQWFIKIPLKEINPNLIKYIEENPFKIAVLANWTFDSEKDQGDQLASGAWDMFILNPPLDEDGNLVYDEFGKLKGDNISLLSHAMRDNVYENLNNHGYDHLVYRTETGPHMGPYTEWVHNYHDSIPEAERHIREEFDVTNNKYSNIKHHQGIDSDFSMKYNNLWHYWNFTGKGMTFSKGNLPEIEGKWLELNQGAKEKYLAKYTELNNTDDNHWNNRTQTLKWSMNNYQNLDIVYGITPNFVNGGSDEMDGFIIKNALISYNDNELGNPLNLNQYGESDFYEKKTPRPYFHFKAYADGYLSVDYEGHGGAKLYAHIGLNNTPQNNASSYKESNIKNRYECLTDNDPSKSGSYIGDIPFDPKDVYVYMVVDPNAAEYNADGTKVEPYVKVNGIEYIESRHLYDVDRHGILPSKDDPIPMYGIQDFDPIGEYWEPGVLFNLSQFNNAQKEGYDYRSISLLRSLSRVEVKLERKSFKKKPSHVYLRSLNRSARIMPVDFITPTDIIWDGFNPANASHVKRLQNYMNAGNVNEYNVMQNTPGVIKEISNIMQYGPIYIGYNTNTNQSAEQKMTEYRKTTAWPFGIWEHQWGWDWNRGKGFVGKFDTYQVGQSRAHTGQIVPEYPRILHTRISRSDYARFIEVKNDPDYWHYIIYVAEKNITDADNPGNIADRPKICHVEIRFNDGLPELDENGDPVESDPENEVDNMDDKMAYRLYFTEGGRANLGSFDFTGRESWDDYEFDWNIAKQHWPIMRNHVYIFTVTGGVNNSGYVDLQVSAPQQRWSGWMFF